MEDGNCIALLKIENCEPVPAVAAGAGTARVAREEMIRHARDRLRMQARANAIDEPDPPDPAIRAIPAAIALGAALLGFAAAMTLVAAWTSTGVLRRSPWEAYFWIVMIAVLLVVPIIHVDKFQ